MSTKHKSIDTIILQTPILSVTEKYCAIVLKRTKMLYYKRTFNLYQNDVKKLGHLSKRHYNKKGNKSFPQSLSGMVGLSLILSRLLINLIDYIFHKYRSVPVMNILVIGQTQFLSSQKLMKSALIALLRT